MTKTYDQISYASNPHKAAIFDTNSEQFVMPSNKNPQYCDTNNKIYFDDVESVKMMSPPGHHQSTIDSYRAKQFSPSTQ